MMNSQLTATEINSNALFQESYRNECRRVHKFMIWLMIAQWIVGIGVATFYTPLTWIGQSYAVHIHVWAAILLGGAISGGAILCVKVFPDGAVSRHAIAICQMLWSALLIHLSGGRFETHFHVFASLACLSIYRDWKILISATAVVAADHFVRGLFYPLSAFGIVTESPYRWMEHAGWVLFEVSFLAPACMRLRNEIWLLCQQKTEIEEAKQSVDIKVAKRTRELTMANQMLAQKTAEAEKLALVARYTDNAVVITDSDLRIEWVNEGFTRITGFELREVLGRRSVEFQHGLQTDAETISRLRDAVVNKSGFDAKVIKYRKSGEPYWLSLEMRPILNENGDVSRFIFIQSDISKQKAMETSLAIADQRLRSLVNNVPGAFYRCLGDEQNTLQFVSNAIVGISGYSAAEFLESRSITKAELVHRDDQQRLETAIREALTNLNEFEIEYRIVDRANQTKWVLERGQCLRNTDGTVGIDGMIFDITDRKLSEAELASKVEIIENSLNEVYIFSATDFQFKYVNRGGRVNIGYSLEELKFMTPLDIKPEFTIDLFRKMVEPLINGDQELLIFQTPHLRKNGTRYIAEVRLQMSRFQNQDVFLAMILDVSDRIEAESRNNQLQRELLDASRKAGMADVATGVLHNVGNILNSVNVSVSIIRKRFSNSALANLERANSLISEHQTGFAEFVRNDERGRKLPGYIGKVTEALSDERRQVNAEFDDLLRNVEHIKEIVNVQQSMAKSSGLIQPMSPTEIITDVLSATKGTLANHQVQIVQEIDDSLTSINSDKHKILQILINLVGNAKDALVEQGTENPLIKLTVARIEDCVVFSVADNGVGILPDKVSKIFQHGFTTKQNGHGFGLHCSANAATELGGKLSVSSAGRGLGATFQLTIPLSREQEKSARQLAVSSS